VEFLADFTRFNADRLIADKAAQINAAVKPHQIAAADYPLGGYAVDDFVVNRNAERGGEGVFRRAVTQKYRLASGVFDPVARPPVKFNRFHTGLYQGDKFAVHGGQHLAGFSDFINLFFSF